MDVREATEEDIQAIGVVAARAWQADYSPAIDEETIEAGVAHWYGEPVLNMELSNPGSTVLLAEIDDEVIGFVHGSITGEVGTILRLHVLPNRQDREVERALLKAIEGTFVDAGVTVRATVLAANEHGRSMYESRGYEQVGTEKTTIDGSQYEEVVYERP
ncbi:MAG: N-acetyltransferase family protein [Halodesulfurarchaeum sp.]